MVLASARMNDLVHTPDMSPAIKNNLVSVVALHHALNLNQPIFLLRVFKNR